MTSLPGWVRYTVEVTIVQKQTQTVFAPEDSPGMAEAFALSRSRFDPGTDYTVSTEIVGREEAAS